MNKAELLSAQDGACFYCSKRLTVNSATRDHLWPKTYGYKLGGNVVLACEKCNRKKGKRLPSIAECQRARRLYQKMGIELITP